MVIRQVKEEKQRVFKEAMKTIRRHPKILYQYDNELSRTFAAFCNWTYLDTKDAIKVLRDAEECIRDEIPNIVTQRYFKLDWSVFSLRTATVLLALIEMQVDDGPRMITPTREIIWRTELLENHFSGWSPPRGNLGPQTIMNAFRLLLRMGILDELIPGDSSLKNDWDKFYNPNRKATIVQLSVNPHQPRPGLIRGHVQPSPWSVSLGTHQASNMTSKPARSLVYPLSLPHKSLQNQSIHGGTVGQVEIREQGTRHQDQLDRYDEGMKRAKEWFREHGNLADLEDMK